jgi:hypothetical protein
MGFFSRDKDEEEFKKKKVEEEETEDEETEDEETEDEETEDEEETDDEESDGETYDASYECDNCNNEGEYEIPFGTTLMDFLKDEKCEFCGCNVINSLKK